MKADNKDTGHNRTIRLTGLESPDQPALTVTVGYVSGKNEPGVLAKASALDHEVIPAILQAINTAALTARQRLLVYAALNYAQSNVDDLNDSFAAYSEEDEDNEGGRVTVGGQTVDGFSAEELLEVIPVFG